jgi:hypothetical protein
MSRVLPLSALLLLAGYGQFSFFALLTSVLLYIIVYINVYCTVKIQAQERREHCTLVAIKGLHLIHK